MSFFEDASLVLIPSAIKDQKVYSVKPTDGSGDLTFSRASNATRVASNGLIEKVRTNNILQSQTFNTASWTNVNTTITANTSAAPDGTLTADRLTDNATNAAHIIVSAINWPAAQRTCSLFVKQGTANKVYIANATSGFGVFFNLSTATIDGTIGSITGTITSLPNGWYRITATHTAASASTLGFGIYETYTGTYATTTEYIGTSKSLELWGAQLETGDIATDYIATTTAAVSVGPVSGLPRLDYLNSSCPRLLLEPQRTNVQTWSEQHDNAAWAKLNLTIIANQATSPSGYQDADLAHPSTGVTNDQNYNSQTKFGLTIGASYTQSVFLKSAGFTWAIVDNMDGGPGAWFNLVTGTIGTITAGSTAKIENYGNGWYRCSVTSAPIGTTGYGDYRLANANGNSNVTASGTSGIYAWGFQLEAGAYATSYIPTLGAAVTRGADAASKTGISSLIGQTEGTLFAEFDFVSGETANYALLHQAAFSTYIFINQGVSGTIFGQIQPFGVSFSAAKPNGRYKCALAYKSGDSAFFVNGVQVGTTNTTTFTPATMDIFNFTADPHTNSNYQALLFKTRLTNAQLAELTA
jgi:hypothetical protein